MTLHIRMNNQISIAIVLSIVLLTNNGAYGRQHLGAYLAAKRQNVLVPQVLFNELLANANEDAFYSELRKYHRQQPNYLTKWPGLRDLLSTADYDDNIDSESNEVLNAHFLERLRQMAASSNVDMLEGAREDNVNSENSVADSNSNSNSNNDANDDGGDAVNNNGVPVKKLSNTPLQSPRTTFKEHNTKKNIQYMSPCHFKICNMGRKRNARYFSNENY